MNFLVKIRSNISNLRGCFDFKLNNNSDINSIIKILSDFKIVENITKAQNDR